MRFADMSLFSSRQPVFGIRRRRLIPARLLDNDHILTNDLSTIRQFPIKSYDPYISMFYLAQCVDYRLPVKLQGKILEAIKTPAEKTELGARSWKHSAPNAFQAYPSPLKWWLRCQRRSL